MNTNEALAIAHGTTTSSPEVYRQALEHLVGHRDELTTRISFTISKNHEPNNDPAWDTVKAGSKSTCGCGSDRVILPSKPRTEFEPGTAITIKPGERVYLKPMGTGQNATLVALWVEEGVLAIADEPFAKPRGMDELIAQLMGMTARPPQAYPLKELAEILPKEPTPPVLCMYEEQKPILTLNAADAKAQTATITLDKDVERFEPVIEKPETGEGLRAPAAKRKGKK
jgi:hypothetical protein